ALQPRLHVLARRHRGPTVERDNRALGARGPAHAPQRHRRVGPRRRHGAELGAHLGGRDG
ncbi:hypothetical protein BN1708_020104, partial [Verticillium longisporum]